MVLSITTSPAVLPFVPTITLPVVVCENSTLSPVPIPIEVLRVAPLSATGSVVPSPTIISPSPNTAIAVTAPVPLPNNIPPSVNEVAPVPPLLTAIVVPSHVPDIAPLQLRAPIFNVSGVIVRLSDE